MPHAYYDYYYYDFLLLFFFQTHTHAHMTLCLMQPRQKYMCVCVFVWGTHTHTHTHTLNCKQFRIKAHTHKRTHTQTHTHTHTHTDLASLHGAGSDRVMLFRLTKTGLICLYILGVFCPYDRFRLSLYISCSATKTGTNFQHFFVFEIFPISFFSEVMLLLLT